MHHRSSHRVFALAAAALCACAGDTTAPRAVAVSVSSPSAAVTQGQTAAITVSVDRTNFTGDVTLAATNLPNGISAVFAPAKLTNGTPSSTLTFSAGTAADTGTKTVTIVASGSGVTADTETVALTCNIAPDFAVSVIPTSLILTQGSSTTTLAIVSRVGAMTGTVWLKATGLPNGVTATFAPDSLKSGSSTSTVTITAAASADSGNHTITIAAASAGFTDRTAALTLTVVPTGSFTIAVAPATLSLGQGASASATVTVERVGTKRGPVTLTAAGLPSGVTAAFSPATLDLETTTSTMTLTAAENAAVGAGTLTIIGSSAGFTDQTANVALTVAPSGSFTIAAAPTTLSLGQGTSGNATITVTRTGTLKGTISLVATGLPFGVTTDFSPAAIDTATATSTLALTVAANAATGTSAITITGSSPGFTSQVTTLTLTVTATGGFTIAASPSSLSIQQGANGGATISIGRTGIMTGAVSLSASGMPSGVTATISPAVVDGTTATLAVSAASSAAAGTSYIMITGTAAGFPTQTTAVAVTVTLAPVGTTITLNFCPNDVPAWVAYQNEGGAWTRAAVSSSAIQFQATGTKLGLAMVFGDAVNGTQAEVSFLTVADLSSTNGKPCVPTTGTKALSGSVVGLGASQVSNLGLGYSFKSVVADGNFQLDGVQDGALDLIAIRLTADALGTSNVPDRMIVRRGVNLTSGSAIPALDFGSAEALAPVSATLSVQGAQSSDVFGSSAVLTSTGMSMSLAASLMQTHSGTVYGLPTSYQLGTDLYDFSGWTTSTTSERSTTVYSSSFGDKTATLGPALNTPTITSAATSPYVRYRVQLATQTEYGRMFSASFSQTSTNRTFSLRVSASYRGSATSWDVTMPDLSAVSGWSNDWGLATLETVGSNVSAVGASFDPFSGAPGDGASEVFASQNTSGIVANRITASRGVRPSAALRAPSARTVAPRFLQGRASFGLR